MKKWSILVEASIQGAKIQGTIACQASDETAAKRLAAQTCINHLRRAGIWTYTDEVNEPYEVEVVGPKDKTTGKPTKKKETKYKKITRYHAPYWDYVKAIKVVEYGSRDLTFPIEELEEAARYTQGISLPKPKRKTTGEAALNGRKKKQASITKKEKQLEKKKKAEANKQSKDELLRVVEAYFIGSEAKIIKEATDELNQTYQRIRYALFQIKDKGYNNIKYDLIQTEIDGSKAFRLKKVSKVMNNLMEFIPSCDCNRLDNTGVYVQYGYVPKNIERPKMEDFWFIDEDNIKCPVCGKSAKKVSK